MKNILNLVGAIGDRPRRATSRSPLPLRILLFFILLLSPIAYRLPPAFSAAGDAVGDCTASPLAVNATVDIRPGSTIEWILHNVKFQLNVEIQTINGSTVVAWKQYVGPAGWPVVMHLTNGNYLRVKNIDGSNTQYICWDGVVTK